MRLHWRKSSLFLLVGLVTSLALPGGNVRADFDTVTNAGQGYGMRTGDGPYGGAQNFQTTPNPVISTGWAANPMGAQSYSVNRFMEAGAIKDCGVGCNRFPYTAWRPLMV